jgi:hypothetical protein
MLKPGVVRDGKLATTIREQDAPTTNEKLWFSNIDVV